MIPDPARTWSSYAPARGAINVPRECEDETTTLKPHANRHIPKPSVLCSEHGRRTEGRCAAPVTYRTFRTIE